MQYESSAELKVEKVKQYQRFLFKYRRSSYLSGTLVKQYRRSVLEYESFAELKVGKIKQYESSVFKYGASVGLSGTLVKQYESNRESSFVS